MYPNRAGFNLKNLYYNFDSGSDSIDLLLSGEAFNVINNYNINYIKKYAGGEVDVPYWYIFVGSYEVNGIYFENNESAVSYCEENEIDPETIVYNNFYETYRVKTSEDLNVLQSILTSISSDTMIPTHTYSHFPGGGGTIFIPESMWETNGYMSYAPFLGTITCNNLDTYETDCQVSCTNEDTWVYFVNYGDFNRIFIAYDEAVDYCSENDIPVTEIISKLSLGYDYVGSYLNIPMIDRWDFRLTSSGGSVGTYGVDYCCIDRTIYVFTQDFLYGSIFYSKYSTNSFILKFSTPSYDYKPFEDYPKLRKREADIKVGSFLPYSDIGDLNAYSTNPLHDYTSIFTINGTYTGASDAYNPNWSIDTGYSIYEVYVQGTKVYESDFLNLNKYEPSVIGTDLFYYYPISFTVDGNDFTSLEDAKEYCDAQSPPLDYYEIDSVFNTIPQVEKVISVRESSTSDVLFEHNIVSKFLSETYDSSGHVTVRQNWGFDFKVSVDFKMYLYKAHYLDITADDNDYTLKSITYEDESSISEYDMVAVDSSYSIPAQYFYDNVFTTPTPYVSYSIDGKSIILNGRAFSFENLPDTNYPNFNDLYENMDTDVFDSITKDEKYIVGVDYLEYHGGIPV